MQRSRFLRTTWLFNSTYRLELPDERVAIRAIDSTESDAMAALARKRNVFARHSWENNFYLARISQLAGTTVVEVFEDGPIDAILAPARHKADTLERLALVSSMFGLQRAPTQARLAITQHRRFGFDLAIAEGFQYLRSSSKQEPRPRGLEVNASFVRRFHRLGFGHLINACCRTDGLSTRLASAMTWLAESRLEPALPAAAVKTAIALESLLIANETESLRGPLSERSAYLLTDDPTRRRAVSRALKAYYDLRSAIVHGGRKKNVAVRAATVEGADRLAALTALTLASHPDLFPSFDRVVDWVEASRWGDVKHRLHRPFPQSHLTRALDLFASADGA